MKWTPIRIRRLREKLGLTQEQFASKLGVAFTTINRWERGRSVPSTLGEAALDTIAKK